MPHSDPATIVPQGFRGRPAPLGTDTDNPTTGGHRGAGGEARPAGAMLAGYGQLAPAEAPHRSRRGPAPGARKRFDLQESAMQLLPLMRVASCMRVPVAKHVSVLYNPDHQAASFGGLACCGSVWTCPVCSARIGARRAEEINQAVAIWQERGGYVCMVTLTMRHHKARRLGDLYTNIRKAYSKMIQGNRWTLFKKRYKIAGYIVSREPTYGSNGWHPHLHVLVFCREPLNTDMRQSMADWYSQRWQACLADLGENATKEHGAVLSDGDEAAGNYIAKLSATWSVGNEIAGVNSKQGKQGGVTPAGLLAKYAAGDIVSGRLYQEYAKATFNTSWLEWSNGLRKEIFGTDDEETDEQIAAAPEKGAIELIALTRYQWYLITRDRLRGELIECAFENDAGLLAQWLIGKGISLQSWQYGYSAAPEGAPG